MELLIFLLILIVFAFAALRWGYDSRDDYESSEWEHRRAFSELETKHLL
jgi:hypothetical protein